MLQAEQGQISAITKTVVHVLSILINPAFGNLFSFPWIRGPHDQLIEYNDAVNSFETVRLTVYKYFTEFDFVGALMAIYHEEDEAQYVMTKMAVLRIVT